jgi:acyl-CoA synthetase (AMP-forming)/AMP-acid ligase II
MTAPSEREKWSEVSPLGDLLVRAASVAPERDALVLPGARWSYTELYQRAMQVACGLTGLGVRRGQAVGILAHNGIEIVEGIFGAALMGAVAVPINARHRKVELRYIIENAELAAVLTLGSAPGAHLDFPDLLAGSLPGLDTPGRERARLDLPTHPHLRAVVALSGRGHRGLMGRDDFNAVAATVRPEAVHEERLRVRVQDPAMMLYTSGTTANPKGCVLNHEAVTRGAVHRARHRYGGDVTWGAGPLFHVGCLSPFIGSVGNAGTYVTDVFFDPGRAIRLLVEERVSVAFPWFPALIQPILDHPDFDAASMDALRSILVIGPRPLIDRVQETFPQAEMLAACGMTETAGIYAISTPDETVAERSEAQGKAVPGVELRIVDLLTGQDAPDGTIGEIVVRGHCVMTEYFRDPEKTASALDADGWLHTGDLYSRTPDGRVIFHGRLKDMLKVGGENVATIEIESFLCQHPAVKMASVVGKQDPRLDEVPVAFVELVEGEALTEQELIEFCKGNISRYKVPAEVHILKSEEWPMSTTKIDKRGLRARLQDASRA